MMPHAPRLSLKIRSTSVDPNSKIVYNILFVDVDMQQITAKRAKFAVICYFISINLQSFNTCSSFLILPLGANSKNFHRSNFKIDYI